MTPDKKPVEKHQNMSQVSSVAGQSPRGLINGAELMKSLNGGAALAGLLSALGACVVALATDFHLWYDGPGKAAIGAGIGIGLMYYRSRQMAKSFADQGDEIDAKRKR